MIAIGRTCARAPIIGSHTCPSRARSKKARNRRSVKTSRPPRYSPDAALAPRVSPPASRTSDACAIYASVRKDATPSREPVDARSRRCRRCFTAPATSTARATAAACWSTSRARSGPRRSAPGGHNPALALDPALRGRARLHRALAGPRAGRCTTPARSSAAGGFRILAERVGAVDSQRARPDRARGGAALLADRRPRRRCRAPRPRAVRARCWSSSASSASTCPRSRPTTCVYKVMGAPEGPRRLLPGPRATSASRPSAASATTATRPTPGRRSSACSRSRCSATTARSTRSPSCARRRGCSASPIPAGGSDSQDLNRMIET